MKKKKNITDYLLNVFFISWLLFGLLYWDREQPGWSYNWFTYTGFIAFGGYLIYSLKKAAKQQDK